MNTAPPFLTRRPPAWNGRQRVTHTKPPASAARSFPLLFPLWAITLALVMAVALSACQPAQQHGASFLVFGTVVDVTLRDVDSSTAEAAFSDLQALFQELHREWHPWQEGALMALNHSIARGQPHAVPARLGRLLQYAQTAERESCGLFNAASGELIHLWGFHTSQFPISGPPPAAAAISTALQHRPSTLDLHLDGRLVRSDNPNLRLDLSGLAKGAAVALALQRLQQQQIPAALVNAGGDLMAYGKIQDRPWQVAIRDPFNAEQGILAQVLLNGSEAVFTSGNYARYREDQQQRYPHIIDPRTGWPVAHVAAATAIHDQAWRADAAATALMITRENEPWENIAARMGITMALIVRQDGAIELTPAMAARLQGAEWRHRVARITPLPGAAATSGQGAPDNAARQDEPRNRGNPEAAAPTTQAAAAVSCNVFNALGDTRQAERS